MLSTKGRAAAIAMAIPLLGTSIAVAATHHDYWWLVVVPLALVLGALVGSRPCFQKTGVEGVELYRQMGRIPVLGPLLRLGHWMNKKLFGFDAEEVIEAARHEHSMPVEKGVPRGQ